MKKKHVFHCAKCNSPTQIYKKGKGHRVLICPKCGILASNPLPLLAMAASSLIPSVIDKFTGKKEVKAKTEGQRPFYPRESYSTEERVEDALAR